MRKLFLVVFLIFGFLCGRGYAYMNMEFLDNTKTETRQFSYSVDEIDSGLKIVVKVDKQNAELLNYVKMFSSIDNASCESISFEKEKDQDGNVIYSGNYPKEKYKNNCELNLFFSGTNYGGDSYIVRLNDFLKRNNQKNMVVEEIINANTIKLADGSFAKLSYVYSPYKEMGKKTNLIADKNFLKEISRKYGDVWGVFTKEKYNEIMNESITFLEKWILGKEVLIELDYFQRDLQGNLLAYVFVKIPKDKISSEDSDDLVALDKENGKYLFINASMIRSGLGFHGNFERFDKPESYFDYAERNLKYSDLLREQYAYPKINGKGLYNAFDMENISYRE